MDKDKDTFHQQAVFRERVEVVVKYEYKNNMKYECRFQLSLFLILLSLSLLCLGSNMTSGYY